MRISKLHIILGIVLVGGLAFLIITNYKDKTMTCAEEVKVCSDGTEVRRVAPSCDFELCLNIGGQRDENGCLISAGYTFEEGVGACARYWEVKAEDKQKAAKMVVEYVGFKKGLTVTEVEVLKCLGCFDVNLEHNEEHTSVSLRDWKISPVNEAEPQIPKPEEEKGDEVSVSIESDFGTKIVYGTSQNVDKISLTKDCEARGGVFNTCGSPCETDAEMCIDVCALTCESIPEKP